MARRLCFSDAHCHVRASTTNVGLPAEHAVHTSTAGLIKGRLRRLVLCGTHPQIDWPLLASIATTSLRPHALLHVYHNDIPSSDTLQLTYSDVNDALTQPCELLVGFGIHPWYVPEVITTATIHQPSSSHISDERCTKSLQECLAELEILLQRHPHAFVGEIGLDKLRGPSEAVQVEAFEAQMRLAAQYNRPVSVHCVRHYGLLLQLLQRLPAEAVPPAIVLHAFTGSTEVARSLLKLKPKKSTTQTAISNTAIKISERIFFSAGSRTSCTTRSFFTEIFPLLQRERRLLLETDAHYECSTSPTNKLQLSCQAAEVYEPLQQLAERVAEASTGNGAPVQEDDSSNDEDEVNVLEDVFALAFQSILHHDPLH